MTFRKALLYFILKYHFYVFIICFFISLINAAKAQSKPNIILILGDDIGYKIPNVNGGKFYSTPNLDMMATQGMKFTQCHTAPLCSPSRFLLLTGKYNFRNYTQWGLMDTSQRTIANLLQDAGYKTACFGKWQFGGGDFSLHKFGFDDYCVWNPLANENSSRYKSPLLYTNGAYISETLTLNKYAEDIFTDSVVNFIENNKTAPFFIYYPMALAHYPFQPTPDDAAFANWDINASDTSYFPSMIKYMDKKIGEIITKIRETGLEDNTIIIYAGDNGTPQNIAEATDSDSLLVKGKKASTTEGGTRVPLFISWPGMLDAGSVNNNLISFTDFLPTLADVANIPVTDFGILDGVSFAPYLTGDTATPRTYLFYSYDPAPGKDTLTRWAQTLQYKLYDTSAKNNHSFYNIVKDPDEKYPIANDLLTPEEVAIKQQLQDIINSYIAQGAPILDATRVSAITDSSATVVNSIRVNYGPPINASGAVWSIVQNPVLSVENHTAENIDNGAFYSFIKTLSEGTTYYVRTYVTSTNNTTYSAQVSFTTPPKAPVSTPATAIDNTSFVAQWNDTGSVDNYKLDVSTFPLFSYPKSDSTTEGFDSGLATKKWYFSPNSITIDTLVFGKTPPSIRFNSSTAKISTPVYTGNITKLSFLLKCTTKKNPGSLIVQGFDGLKWKIIDNITDIPTSGIIKVYDSSSPAWANNFIRFNFTYTKLNGNLNLDDVVVNYTSNVSSFVQGYNGRKVTNSSQVVSGLQKNTQYYYRVRAQNMYGISGNSNTISVHTENVGLTPPVCIAATDIFKSGFTANWSKVTAAESYKIDVSISPSFSTLTPTSVNEGFDNGAISPSGWVFSNNITADTMFSGKLLPSIQLDNSGDSITTIRYPAAVTRLSFFIQGLINNAGSLLVEGYNGNQWKTIENITNIPSIPVTKIYDSALLATFGKNFIQFRFIYKSLSGAIDLDDVSASYVLSAPSYINSYQDLTVNNNFLKISGLDNNKKYYYRVRAVCNKLADTSKNSNTIEATTCSKPVISKIAITNPSCNNDNLGAIDLTVRGEGLAYNWTGVDSFVSSKKNIDKLVAGTYHLAVTSYGICEVDTSITIINPAALIATITAPPITCSEGTTIITVNATGGSGKYNYSLFNGTNTTISQNDNHFVVGTGTYSVIVEDNNHCYFTTDLTINSVTATCIDATVFPNPATTEFNLVIEDTENEKMKIVVTNMYGDKVYETVGNSTGRYTFGKNFASGVYILHIQKRNISKKIKLVKIE